MFDARSERAEFQDWIRLSHEREFALFFDATDIQTSHESG